MNDDEQPDPRARWRRLPARVEPTGTSMSGSNVEVDHDITSNFDRQTEVVRTFW